MYVKSQTKYFSVACSLTDHSLGVILNKTLCSCACAQGDLQCRALLGLGPTG